VLFEAGTGFQCPRITCHGSLESITAAPASLNDDAVIARLARPRREAEKATLGSKCSRFAAHGIDQGLLRLRRGRLPYVEEYKLAHTLPSDCIVVARRARKARMRPR
jgi:hypothetical protein